MTSEFWKKGLIVFGLYILILAVYFFYPQLQSKYKLDKEISNGEVEVYIHSCDKDNTIEYVKQVDMIFEPSIQFKSTGTLLVDTIKPLKYTIEHDNKTSDYCVICTIDGYHPIMYFNVDEEEAKTIYKDDLRRLINDSFHEKWIYSSWCDDIKVDK